MENQDILYAFGLTLITGLSTDISSLITFWSQEQYPLPASSPWPVCLGNDICFL